MKLVRFMLIMISYKLNLSKINEITITKNIK